MNKKVNLGKTKRDYAHTKLSFKLCNLFWEISLCISHFSFIDMNREVYGELGFVWLGIICEKWIMTWIIYELLKLINLDQWLCISFIKTINLWTVSFTYTSCELSSISAHYCCSFFLSKLIFFYKLHRHEK